MDQIDLLKKIIHGKKNPLKKQQLGVLYWLACWTEMSNKPNSNPSCIITFTFRLIP